MTTLADLVDPEKLAALHAVVGVDETKDVSTFSAPPQETSGFGAAEDDVEGTCAFCKRKAKNLVNGKLVCDAHIEMPEGDEGGDGEKAELVELEFKADGPMEHKNDAGTAVIDADDDTGMVTSIVSVTGIVDRVDDIIEVGAYDETIATREPIGVWSHDDKTWVARLEEAKELRPGDPFFSTPEFIAARGGKAWPAKAGALLVKSRFNLETPHGAAAYSDVKFFQGKTGWSIGYRVKKAVRDMRTGVRRIKSLDWFEFSPVMVGAAADSMTLSVKSLSQPVDAQAIPESPEFDLELWDAEIVADYEAKRAAFIDALEGKAGRHVRTPEGAQRYHEPIGSLILDPRTGDSVHGTGGGPNRMVGDGWEVDVINLNGAAKLRVKHQGYMHGKGYYDTPAELAAAGVPLAKLRKVSHKEGREHATAKPMRMYLNDLDNMTGGRGLAALKAKFDDEPLEVKRGGLDVAQKCNYCAKDATKYVLHSEGMAYVAACDDDLGKAKDDAADCTPDGTRDESNIVRVGDLPPRGETKDDGELDVAEAIARHLEIQIGLDLEEKAERHVRTPAGEKVFGKPIGSLITAADVARVKAGASGGRHEKAPDAGQGEGTTRPGQVHAKTPPAATRARMAAEDARARAHAATDAETAALHNMEADVLERFAQNVDIEDAKAYDKPGTDPVHFHGGEPSGLKRLLKNRLPHHLKKAETEAAIAIVAVEASTMIAFAMGAGEHGHLAMGVAVGTHMLVAAASALKEALKEHRASHRGQHENKAFEPGAADAHAKFGQAVVAATRDEWDKLPDEPLDDEAYNGLMTRIMARVLDELKGDEAEAPDDTDSEDAEMKTDLYDEIKAATALLADIEGKGVRHVRTQSGVREFGQPIGSIIKPDEPAADMDFVGSGSEFDRSMWAALKTRPADVLDQPEPTTATPVGRPGPKQPGVYTYEGSGVRFRVGDDGKRGRWSTSSSDSDQMNEDVENILGSEADPRRWTYVGPWDSKRKWWPEEDERKSFHCASCASTSILSTGACGMCGVKADEPDLEVKRMFSAAKRRELADKGHAMSDGSFPIETHADVHHAIHAIGRAKDPASAKAHIKKRAKDVGCNHVPGDWSSEKKSADLMEAAADEVVDAAAGETLFGEPDLDEAADYELPSADDLEDPELIADVINVETELVELGLIDSTEGGDEAKAATMTHEPLGTPGGKQNWVDKTGQLPAYIQHIAKDLHEERGMTLSRAIATAISQCKKWAAGGEGVKPETRAKAAKAIAEWEALKAKNAARRAAKDAGMDLTWFDYADAAEFKVYGHDTEYVIVDSIWKAEQLADALDVPETKEWSDKARAAALLARRLHSHHTEAPAAGMRRQMASWDAADGTHHNTEHPTGSMNFGERRAAIIDKHTHGADGRQPGGDPVHSHSHDDGPQLSDPVMSDTDLDRLAAASRARGFHQDAAAIEEVRKLPPNKRYARLQMYRHGKWQPAGTAANAKGAGGLLSDYLEVKSVPMTDPDAIVVLDESEILAARRLQLALD